ncbi:MAG: hemerythrin domain-containing protein [bacterium]|nr:hemerythrin domain-containing protein [bacterium]
MNISLFMHQDHQRCDHLFAEAEDALDAGGGAGELSAFLGAMACHFDMEETILFPVFEDKTGMKGMGPTEVMRQEHQQMRQLLAQMQSSLDQGDTQAALRPAETLMILMQQHNLKEENILYPMLDQQLAKDEMIPQLEALRDGA